VPLLVDEASLGGRTAVACPPSPGISVRDRQESVSEIDRITHADHPCAICARRNGDLRARAVMGGS
jgi:hypothetical protein